MLKELRDRYDCPFTLTRDNTVFVPTGQVPFKLGTLDLEQVVLNKISQLKQELQHWEQLWTDNNRALEREQERILYDND